MRVLLSSFRCAAEGKSEAYVGYKWLEQVGQRHHVSLITGDRRAANLDDVDVHFVKPALAQVSRYAKSLFGSIKPHYFTYDLQCKRRFRAMLSEYRVYHHVTPIAPRYPSSLGCVAERFVLGPVGGGLRVPPAFRKEVEASESSFFRLRNLDQIRLRADPFIKRTYERADVLLLAAEYMRDIIPDRYQKNVEIMLETGIDPDDYSECSPERTDGGRIRLLYVGRVVPYKGLKYLLKGLAAVSGCIRRDIQLIVAGNDTTPYARECRRLSENLGLSGQVTFTGGITKDAVQELYKSADMFCFPTLAETSGNAVLEAMASGLPILYVAFGGPAEIAGPDCGAGVEPDTPERLVESIAASISRFADSKELRIRCGRRAQERALVDFAWDRKGEFIDRVYRSLQ